MYDIKINKGDMHSFVLIDENYAVQYLEIEVHSDFAVWVSIAKFCLSRAQYYIIGGYFTRVRSKDFGHNINREKMCARVSLMQLRIINYIFRFKELLFIAFRFIKSFTSYRSFSQRFVSCDFLVPKPFEISKQRQQTHDSLFD